MKYIGTPRNDILGIHDLSLLPKLPEDSEYGQYLPLAFIMAEKGPFEQTVLSGGEAIATYGGNTFTPKTPYYNHSTIGAVMQMKACSVSFQRIDMGGKEASITHFIDIATKTQDIYKRDEAGQELPVSDVQTADADTLIIRHVIKEGVFTASEIGTMKNEDGSDSIMYPIYTKVGGVGSYYNNLGHLFVPKIGVDSDDIKAVKNYIYEYNDYLNVEGADMLTETILGSAGVVGTFLPSKNAITGDDYDFIDRINDSYTGDFNFKFYIANIEIILKRLAENEANYLTDHEADIQDNLGNVPDLTEWFDGTADELRDMPGILNHVNLLSTKGIKYFSISMDDAIVPVAGYDFIDSNTLIYLTGGTDFDASIVDEKTKLDYFDTQVRVQLSKYLDESDPVVDMALNPISTIVDTGFSLPTKLVIADTLAFRKDIFVILSTQIADVDDETRLTEEEQLAIGLLLKGRLSLVPESVYFTTEACRAIINFGTARLANHSYKGIVPITMSLISKMALFFGAGSKQWSDIYAFDAGDTGYGAATSVAEELYDVYPKTPPRLLKDNLWTIGINWLSPKALGKVYYWPAFATIASEASVLNSAVVVMAASWITKVENEVAMQFQGVTRYSPAIFKLKVEDKMTTYLRDAFSQRYLISPRVVFDDVDEMLGYQYHLDTRLGANNMYTVAKTSITTVRKANF